MADTNELVQELRYYARHGKDGKMGEECIVPKTLLADAAAKLEEFLNNEYADDYEPAFRFFRDW